jgi:hypothetical protein
MWAGTAFRNALFEEGTLKGKELTVGVVRTRAAATGKGRFGRSAFSGAR